MSSLAVDIRVGASVAPAVTAGLVANLEDLFTHPSAGEVASLQHDQDIYNRCTINVYFTVLDSYKGGI